MTPVAVDAAQTTGPRTAGPPGPDARPTRPHPLVGVVGGMGPLASAELLRTIYRSSRARSEQEAPRVLLWSDPAVVDRTEAIGRGELQPLRRAVETAVRGLLASGAERVVIACVTAHRVLEDLVDDLTDHCVSLVDVIHQELARATEPHLLLCTKGTARAGLLVPRAPGAAAARAARLLVPLEPDDQDALHREVYRVKRGGDPARTVDFLHETLPRYGLRAFVAACTELHLVTRAIQEAGRSAEFPAIDPLAVVAHRITNGEL